MAGPTVKGDTLLAAQSNRILSLSGQPATMTVEKYRQTVAPLKNRWIDWFNDYDPSDNIRKTRCQVFALNGDRDCQVISSLCLPALKQLLPTSKKHLIKEYPSLNHLFQHCTTGLPEEYSQIEETISPEVLQDMAEWIKALNSNKATSQQWCFPLPGAKVISPYGKRGKRSHSGVDIKTKDRDSIYAAFDGEVVFSKPYHGYGNLIRIKHANGLETCYSHNSENWVKEGQHVKAGQVIALVGQTGRATTPHLHFEIRVNGKARNPANYFDFKKYVYRKR
jgi:murein DD-endopeptidase MepM/ murein hydrolase activator NlpD